MNWKNTFDLHSYEWWAKHRRVVTFGGLLLIFCWWLNPTIQESKYKNRCIELAKKEILANTTSLAKALSSNELALLQAYQTCNHRS